jgi:hypothetical protein
MLLTTILMASLMPTGSASADTDMTTNLVACWDLDEDSGVRYDAYSTNDLTDNNTVGQAAGRIDSAAMFAAANSEYLSINGANFRFGNTSWTISTWIYLDNTSADHGVYALQGEYDLYYRQSSSGFRLTIYDGSATAVATVTYTGGVSAETWLNVVSVYDAASGTAIVYVNNSSTSVASGGTPGSSTNALYFGRRLFSYSSSRLDLIGVWNRVLDTTEISWLYNSGAGRSCTEIIATGTPATATPTPTATPTATPTPTPGVDNPVTEVTTVLTDDGDAYTVRREFTYGDLATVFVVGILLVLFIVSEMTKLVDRWLP